jgi:hypothetical protein
MVIPIAEEMFDFRNLLASKGIVFNYSGFVTEDILTSIGRALRDKLALEGAERRTAQRLFSIFVEQMQNIIRYSAETADKNTDLDLPDLRYGLLSVGEVDGRYFISCCNLVESSDAARLNEALTEISNMDRDELKKAYKQTLRSGPPPGSKGAGIGFIEIARQTTHGFEFGFKELPDDKSYFCLKAYV